MATIEPTGRLARKDTTKGPPLRILSLDGGGVRGYSMLIIIQELMHRIFVETEGRAPKRHEIPKPCDHFDLIAGMGTGGLIAIMLGRLRLDLDTCKELYVRMTRRVFETDKTLLGLPLRGTMFKATKLEESIRDSVREHTIFEDEGNDSLASAVHLSSQPGSSMNSPGSPRTPARSMSQSSRYSQIGTGPNHSRISFSTLRFGNPDALLYDSRENRTKTAVTAVLKGTNVTTLLRSYDSRRETAPDVGCTIWQAGRATSATAMAFKPVQIGQTVYLDEGAGQYNPAPIILDEAVQNEWPGREVGVFVSIGTGKRPTSSGNANQHEWWEGFLGGSMGDFAEARRRLIAKLEACEDTHRYMLREHLTSRGVPTENYFRLNVEVGVGELGMNEWNRLADMTTKTRMYLARNDVQAYSSSAAQKLAKIHLAKVRIERAEAARRAAAASDHPQYSLPPNGWGQSMYGLRPLANPSAIELPGDNTGAPPPHPDYYYDSNQKYTLLDHDNHPYQPNYPYQHRQRPSVADAKYIVTPEDQPPTPPSQYPAMDPRMSVLSHVSAAYQVESLPSHARSSPPSRHSQDVSQPATSATTPTATSAPPLPPKTPLQQHAAADRSPVSSATATPTGPPAPTTTSTGGLPYPAGNSGSSSPPRTFMHMGDLARRLPYPDAEGPPPPVNTANKPQIAR